ncbi:hypothetical protein DVH24_016602 [Malus domestica]|uniref:Uncharacterized protein n=1 Tax=Malus domestica TaxID=3750 RepID=A0A498HSR4_MALDO|nr:hypothetical protein DVH24_016602 [Malus domestica]
MKVRVCLVWAIARDFEKIHFDITEATFTRIRRQGHRLAHFGLIVSHFCELLESPPCIILDFLVEDCLLS